MLTVTLCPCAPVIFALVFYAFLPSCRIVWFVDTEPAVQVRGGRPRSTASTSSSEISVAEDNASLDLLHDVLQDRDIVRTKVSQTSHLLSHFKNSGFVVCVLLFDYLVFAARPMLSCNVRHCHVFCRIE